MTLKELMQRCYDAGASVDPPMARPFVEWWEDGGEGSHDAYRAQPITVDWEEVLDVGPKKLPEGMVVVCDNCGHEHLHNDRPRPGCCLTAPCCCPACWVPGGYEVKGDITAKEEKA